MNPGQADAALIELPDYSNMLMGKGYLRIEIIECSGRSRYYAFQEFYFPAGTIIASGEICKIVGVRKSRPSGEQGGELMLVIDRFEGELAVIELSEGKRRRMFTVPRAALPSTAGEGDVVVFIIDEEETAERRAGIETLADELFE